MSSPASRSRQRQRRRARERLWTAQSVLAERRRVLAAYDAVIADMTNRQQNQDLSYTGTQAIPTIVAVRDTTRAECALLERSVDDLADSCKKLEPEQISS